MNWFQKALACICDTCTCGVYSLLISLEHINDGRVNFGGDPLGNLNPNRNENIHNADRGDAPNEMAEGQHDGLETVHSPGRRDNLGYGSVNRPDDLDTASDLEIEVPTLSISVVTENNRLSPMTTGSNGLVE